MSEEKAAYGMELRDYFAAAAVQGILAGNENASPNPWELARDAYKIADAMLQVREEK